MEALKNSFRIVANHAFVELPSVTQGGYITEGGIIILGKRGRLEEAAAVTGTVVALPERPLYVEVLTGHDEQGRGIYKKLPLELREGDKVAVNYMVVSQGNWEDERFKHKNCWMVGGNLVWKTEPDNILAVFRDGRWQAVGDYALLKAVTRTKYQSSLLIIPESVATEVESGRGEHISGLDAAAGDRVAFFPQYAATYDFGGGDEYLVIKKDYVWGEFDSSSSKIVPIA